MLWQSSTQRNNQKRSRSDDRVSRSDDDLRHKEAAMRMSLIRLCTEASGIKEGTVKTHLHHLFEKTDTTRQADLVKLVAGCSSPLVG